MRHRLLLPTLLLLLVFGLFIFPNNNLDLGWHLKYGEFLVNHHRLLNQNTFSWTLPDYRWVNHSWGYDLLSYLLFLPFGFIGHTLINAALATLAFTLIYLIFKPKAKAILPVFVLTYLFLFPLFAIGLRSQTLSILGLIYCLYLGPKMFGFTSSTSESGAGIAKTTSLRRARRHLVAGSRARRFWYTEPDSVDWLLSLFIFLFWANLHGQFMLGLGFLGLLFIGRLLTKKLSPKKALKPALWLLSLCLITLVNPYGIFNHLETFRYLNYPYFNLIAEWSPFPKETWQWWLLVGYTLSLIVYSLKNKRQVDWSYFGVCLFFGIQAFLYRRISPFFFLTTLPLLIPALTRAPLPTLGRHLRLPLTVLSLLLVYLVLIPARKPFLKSWSDYCLSDISLRCSSGLTDYLNAHPLTGRTFSYYNWGGFLIYNTPQTPVYIDGRMTLWQDNTGFAPLYHHTQIYFIGNNAQTLFEAGNFDAAIIQSGIPLEKILIQKYGWQALYRDPYTSVLKNPQSASPAASLSQP